MLLKTGHVIDVPIQVSTLIVYFFEILAGNSNDHLKMHDVKLETDIKREGNIFFVETIGVLGQVI